MACFDLGLMFGRVLVYKTSRRGKDRVVDMDPPDYQRIHSCTQRSPGKSPASPPLIQRIKRFPILPFVIYAAIMIA
jgi:hypothetical protein